MELTEQQIKRQDFVDNAIFELINELFPSDKEVEWDIEAIGEIRDAIQSQLVTRSQDVFELRHRPRPTCEERHERLSDSRGLQVRHSDATPQEPQTDELFKYKLRYDNTKPADTIRHAGYWRHGTAHGYISHRTVQSIETPRIGAPIVVRLLRYVAC